MPYLIGQKTADWLANAMRGGSDLRSRRRNAPRTIADTQMPDHMPLDLIYDATDGHVYAWNGEFSVVFGSSNPQPDTRDPADERWDLGALNNGVSAWFAIFERNGARYWDLFNDSSALPAKTIVALQFGWVSAGGTPTVHQTYRGSICLYDAQPRLALKEDGATRNHVWFYDSSGDKIDIYSDGRIEITTAS